MTQKISRKTLQEEVYKSLKDSILRNEYLPGKKLSIEQLAQDLGVSPTPVREAMAKLNSDGLIKLSRNKKAMVTEITEDDVYQTYEVRKLLEPYVASEAAKKIKSNPALKDDLQELKHKIEELQKIVTNTSLIPSQYEEYLQVDQRLDVAIIRVLRNTLLKKLLTLVNAHSTRIRSFAEAVSKPYQNREIQLNNKEHLAIIRALLDGDYKRAQEVVQQHLENAESRTIQAVSRTIESENMNRDKENLH